MKFGEICRDRIYITAAGRGDGERFWRRWRHAKTRGQSATDFGSVAMPTGRGVAAATGDELLPPPPLLLQLIMTLALMERTNSERIAIDDR